MHKRSISKKLAKPLSLPLVFEEDSDGGYVVECPILPGCYTQGKTHEEALANIREVIEMLLEEESNRDILANYQPKTIVFQTITI